MILGASILGAVELGGITGGAAIIVSFTNTLDDATLVSTATFQQDEITISFTNTLDDATLQFTAFFQQPTAPVVPPDVGCITLDEMVDGGVLTFDDQFEEAGIALDFLIAEGDALNQDDLVKDCT